MNEIDFAGVDDLRKGLLLSVKDICAFFGVSRETYYTWQKGGQPRPTLANKIREKIRLLLYALIELGWPTPEAIALRAKDRYAMLMDALDGQ